MSVISAPLETDKELPKHDFADTVRLLPIAATSSVLAEPDRTARPALLTRDPRRENEFTETPLDRTAHWLTLYWFKETLTGSVPPRII